MIAEVDAETLRLLRRLLPDEQAVEQWLSTPHEKLDGMSPLDVIRSGGADAVWELLEAASLGLSR